MPQNTSKKAQGLRGKYTPCATNLIFLFYKPISRDSDLDELISTCTEQSHQLTGHHSLLPGLIFTLILWTHRKIGFGQFHYENWGKSTYNGQVNWVILCVNYIISYRKHLLWCQKNLQAWIFVMMQMQFTLPE